MSAVAADQQHPERATILIVDDHPLLCRGVAALLATTHDLSLCAQAGTSAAALAAIREKRPALVIVDLGLGLEVDDGLTLLKEIRARHPGVKTLVLSMRDELVYAERCMRAGALGYVEKQALDETLLLAIHRVLDGQVHLSDKLLRHMGEKYLHAVRGNAPGTVAAVDTLSDRQLQVYRLIGQGRSTRQIAAALQLSVKTIESHREHLKHKLGIESGVELARRAGQWVNDADVAAPH